MERQTQPAHVILVVDDDSDIRDTLADVLADEGYKVRTASNGLEALASMRDVEEPPCLVILDLMMPVMNGFEFLLEHRSDPSIASIPVAVITAHGALGREERKALRVPVLPKPIQLPKLLDVVSALC